MLCLQKTFQFWLQPHSYVFSRSPILHLVQFIKPISFCAFLFNLCEQMWLRGRQVAGLRKNPDCYFELLKFFNSVGSSSFVNYDVIFFFHSEMVTVFFFVCFF